MPTKELDRRLSRFMDTCRRSAHRITHQRLEVVREVASTNDHPDIETIYNRVRKRMPTVSLETVYRTMRLLLAMGLASAVPTDQERMRYDANTIPHHHFVCTRCGEVYDFYSEDFDQLQIPREVRAHGTVQKTQVEMRGTCLRCAPAKSQESMTSATRRQPWRRY